MHAQKETVLECALICLILYHHDANWTKLQNSKVQASGKSTTFHIVV